MVSHPLKNQYPHPNSSPFALMRWAMRMPLASLSGERMLDRISIDPWPQLWQGDCTDRNVLIVGSGPSLDRVGEGFFTPFDTAFYINFAFARQRTGHAAYFFTTDISPAISFVEQFGDGAFRVAGRERCLVAPFFYDQVDNLSETFGTLFSFLRPQQSHWHVRKGQVAGVAIPQTIARHPVQPNWEHYELLPPTAARIPVVDYTSAFSAIILAAMNGAKSISLIGCDFSPGRAKEVASMQEASGARTFRDARGEFGRIAAMLARHGITARNLSWEV